MNTESLFESVRLGDLTLKSRIVLPPLTRSRSTQPGNIPNDMMATYYAQRASAGFMVSEGTQVEPRGQGYAWTPGISTPEQVEGLEKGHRGRSRRRRYDLLPALACGPDIAPFAATGKGSSGGAVRHPQRNR